PGAFCAVNRGRDANQPSRGYEFAIISLATSPYDCKTRVAPIPLQNVMRKRKRARVARLRSDGCPFGNGSFSKVVGRTGGGSLDATTGNRPRWLEEVVVILISPRAGFSTEVISRPCTGCRSASRQLRKEAANPQPLR